MKRRMLSPVNLGSFLGGEGCLLSETPIPCLWSVDRSGWFDKTEATMGKLLREALPKCLCGNYFQQILMLARERHFLRLGRSVLPISANSPQGKSLESPGEEGAPLSCVGTNRKSANAAGSWMMTCSCFDVVEMADGRNFGNKTSPRRKFFKSHINPCVF